MCELFVLKLYAKKSDLLFKFQQEISPGGVDTEISGDIRNRPDIKAYLEANPVPILKSADVSQTVLFMLMTPYEVNITEMIIKPTGEKV